MPVAKDRNSMANPADKARRASPLDYALFARPAEAAVLNQMRVARSIADDTEGRIQLLGIADVSAFVRVGLKGPGAAEFLKSHGIVIPPSANQWVPIGAHALVSRLGRTEFLIEDETISTRIEDLRTALLSPPEGVYPVPRSDCALALIGSRVNELFVQTCNVDFSAQRASDHIVTLTQMVGLSVTVLHDTESSQPRWRIWCDGTFGPYLWETLIEIAKELGGGAVGLQRAYPHLVLT